MGEGKEAKERKVERGKGGGVSGRESGGQGEEVRKVGR